jgi:predicted TIM-barrel fold metal-dependent hydrolase
MLVDINAYIGHWPFKRLMYNTCSAMLERMDSFGVDTAVISNLNGIFYKDTQSANDELFEEIRSEKKFLRRFIPFAVINPIYAGWRNDLETCSTKMGMKGVSIYPLYHDYEITDPACIELVKRARDKGMVISIAQRIVDSRQRSHMDISQEYSLKDMLPLLKAVPDAKYFLVNAANSITVSNDDTEFLKKVNFCFDTSGRVLSDLGAMIKKYGKEKFAFGTHAPVLDYAGGLLRIEALRSSEADSETMQLLRSGNAQRMLGI